MTTHDAPAPDIARRHRRVAVACAVFVASMVGAAYAAVPLYDLFCKVTGFGGTTQVSTAAPLAPIERTVKVRFDANVAPGLGWDFAPETREVTVKLGETRMVVFKATNRTQSSSWGTSTFNVTPEITGGYFAKLQCFCFEKQELRAGESMDMPVVFYVDPEMVKDADASRVHTITLSYTFFPTDAPEEMARGGETTRRM